VPQARAVRRDRDHHAQLEREPVSVNEVLVNGRLTAGDLEPDHPGVPHRPFSRLDSPRDFVESLPSGPTASRLGIV
jgi:hypothetical protein